MEWLTNLYLGCFIFGLIFTIVSFLLGGIDHFTFGGHVGVDAGHSGHGGHVHADAHTGHSSDNGADSHAQTHSTSAWSLLNFNALVVFLTWFGGTGFILKSIEIGNLLSLVLAVASGIIGYTLVILFLTKVLLPSQTEPMRLEDYKLSGTVAHVSSTIFENGVGEVSFNKHGTHRAVAARSVNGQPFSRDSEVVILSFDKGIALVDDLNRLLTEAGAEKWTTTNTTNDIEEPIQVKE